MEKKNTKKNGKRKNERERKKPMYQIKHTNKPY